MDRAQHNRYLDYRERHSYFGAQKPLLSGDAFLAAESEWESLHAAGSDRDEEDEARYADLTALLFRD